MLTGPDAWRYDEIDFNTNTDRRPHEHHHQLPGRAVRPTRPPLRRLPCWRRCWAAGRRRRCAAAIKFNQLGFLPASQKLAVVDRTVRADSFAVLDAASGKTVFEGRLGAPAHVGRLGRDRAPGRFLDAATPGSYRIRVAGQPDSAPFPIAPDAYRALDAAAIKAYYYQRAGIAHRAALRGRVRAPAGPSGHPGAGAPVGRVGRAPGRHRDHAARKAGTTPATTTSTSSTPASAPTRCWPPTSTSRQFFDGLALNIPETGNGLPDVLNEALWNLEWMATMQDPNDGGVYHKLTNKQFDAFVMPDKATHAALRGAEEHRRGARLRGRDGGRQPRAGALRQAGRRAAPQRYLAQAEKAWAWAVAHPDVVYRQPADVGTGGYGDNKLDDEFSWAATELLIATGKDAYRARAFDTRRAARQRARLGRRAPARLDLAESRQRN